VNPARILSRLGWSTSQGDAAVQGARASRDDLEVAACPYPPRSTLAWPWQAGWVAATAKQAGPPDLSAPRATLRAWDIAGQLAIRVDESLRPST
jgi:hypothetical protein